MKKSVFFLLLWVVLPLSAEEISTPKILVVGDSIGAAYGLSPTQGWVHLLDEKLLESGYSYRMINASISGDTTSGGRYRIERSLETHRPEIVLIELGGNDGLRGLSLKQMRQNLQSMIEAAKQHDAEVILLGMRIPPNYGPAYTEKFHATYQTLAEKYQTALVPFLLDGIELSEKHLQSDGIHPTAAAQPIIVDNVWQVLEALLNEN